MNITAFLTECVNTQTPVVFCKYGDGEFQCAFNPNTGHNCDNDLYTENLSRSLKESFQYIVANHTNCYIGLWNTGENKKDWESIVKQKIKWVDYHSIIIDNDKTHNSKKYLLYKAIKHSKMKKIIVCNRLLIKSKNLLNIDECIFVDFNNWFDNKFNIVLQEVSNAIGSDENHIIITCCGMGAKVLISELAKKFSRGIYLDFGSALDLICTKRDSRGRNYDYDHVSELFKDFLSDDWEDNKWNQVYEEARQKLGLHLK